MSEDIRIMRDTGLYGEDEDDLYDVIAKPSPHGNGFDVIRPLKGKGKGSQGR
jgi:hypothetical protein